MHRSPLLLSVAIATATLIACKPATPTADAPLSTTAERPAETSAPEPVAAAPDSAKSPATSQDQASFAGFGDMQLGSTVDEAKAAWGGELNGKAMEGSSCYYLSPKWVNVPSDLAFMIEEGRFVRYDVGTTRQAAPGGGKVGMSADELQQLYKNALESAPHKYVEGGRNLSLDASGVQASKLVFETDAAGKITAWRVGLSPQVDYVEGCS